MREHFLPRELEIIKDVFHANIIKLHSILRLQTFEIDRIFIISGKQNFKVSEIFSEKLLNLNVF
jgi:hypothetical protein